MDVPIEKAKKAFSKLLLAKSIGEVNQVLVESRIPERYWMDEATYPEIKFNITRAEIEELRSLKILTNKNQLAIPENLSTLEKLLYGVVWKNGDLKKLNHIVDGVIDTTISERKNGFVFYQFGKYLSKKQGEPIIDQHVLRAFGVFNGLNEKDIARLLKMSIVSKNEMSLITRYKHWLSTDLTSDLRSISNYSYHVDKVMFAIGKSIKQIKHKRSSSQ